MDKNKEKKHSKRRSSILKLQNMDPVIAAQDTTTFTATNTTKRISSRRVSFAEMRVVKEFDKEGTFSQVKSPHHEPAYQDSLSSNDASQGRPDSKMSITHCLTSDGTQIDDNLQQTNYLLETMQETNISSNSQKTNMSIESMQETKIAGQTLQETKLAPESMEMTRVVTPALSFANNDENTGNFLNQFISTPIDPNLQAHLLIDQWGFETETGEDSMETEDLEQLHEETTNIKQLIERSRQESGDDMELTKAISASKTPTPEPATTEVEIEKTENILAAFTVPICENEASSAEMSLTGASSRPEVDVRSQQSSYTAEESMEVTESSLEQFNNDGDDQQKSQLQFPQIASETPDQSPAIEAKRRRIKSPASAKSLKMSDQVVTEEKEVVEAITAHTHLQHKEIFDGTTVVEENLSVKLENVAQEEILAEETDDSQEDEWEQTMTNLHKKLRRSMDMSFLRQIPPPFVNKEEEMECTGLTDISAYLMDSRLGVTKPGHPLEQEHSSNIDLSANLESATAVQSASDTSSSVDQSRPSPLEFDPDLFNMELFVPEFDTKWSETKQKLMQSCLAQYQRQVMSGGADKINRAIRKLQSSVQQELSKIRDEEPKLESAIRNLNMSKFDPELQQLWDTCQRKAEAEWLQYNRKMAKTLSTAVEAEIPSAEKELTTIRKCRQLVKTLPEMRQKRAEIDEEYEALRKIDLADVKLYGERLKILDGQENVIAKTESDAFRLEMQKLEAQSDVFDSMFELAQEQVEKLKKQRKIKKNAQNEQNYFFEQILRGV